MNTYSIGTRVRVYCRFYDLDEALASPTTVTAELLEPGETVGASLNVTEQSTGVYYADMTTAEAGIHRVLFEGTGALVVTGEHAFSVRRSYF